MSACFRRRFITLFMQRQLLNERRAKNMVQRTHSGFSADSCVRIPAVSTKALEVLSQYIVRPRISLQELLVDEGRDAVVCRAPYSDCFRVDLKIFPPTAFLAELSEHLPDARYRLNRCCGLYSPQARGTWSHTPYPLRLAPEGRKHNHPGQPTVRFDPPDEHQEDCSVVARQSRSAWARLIMKVYEADPLTYMKQDFGKDYPYSSHGKELPYHKR